MRTTFFILVLFLFQLSYSQDIITTRKGDDIKAKVIEIGQQEVKYKKFENQEGPTYSIYKSEIMLIRYANGSKDIFSNETSVVKSKDVSELKQTQPDNLKYNFVGMWECKEKNLNIIMNITTNGNGYLIKQYLSKENYIKDLSSTINVVIYQDENNNIVANTYRSDYNKFTVLNDSTFELTTKFSFTGYKYKKLNQTELSNLKTAENLSKGYAFRSRGNVSGIEGMYYGAGSSGILTTYFYAEGRFNKSDFGIGINIGDIVAFGGSPSNFFSLGLASNYHIPLKIDFFDPYIGVRGDYLWGHSIGFNYYVGTRLYLTKSFAISATYYGKGSSFTVGFAVSN
jgi:hypothetical protein